MTTPVGMDHAHYDFSPVPERKVLRWPGNKPLAVTVFLYLEHWHTYAQPDAVREPRFHDPFGRFEPEYRGFSLRLYGLRIGIFRVLAALDRAPFRSTAPSAASRTCARTRSSRRPARSARPTEPGNAGDACAPSP